MIAVVFQWPWMLALILGAIPLWMVMRHADAKSRSARTALGGGSVTKASNWMEVAVYALIVLALARPGYNPTRFEISESGRDVVFALDVSRSMLAQDAFPSRLEAAKQGIRDCLDTFVGEQVGLVIYGGSSSISCPLTSDYDFVRYMLSQVEPRIVEFGGTLLLSAIEKSIDQVFSKERKGFQDLIVLTDGEDHGPGVERMAERVRESGVDLLLVGIGDSKIGSRIPIANDEGDIIPLKHEEAVVYSKLESAELSALAKKSPNSEYIEVGTLPFHLGDEYTSFSEGKGVKDSGGDSSYTVYEEGAFLIMPMALVLALLLAGNFGRTHLSTSMAALVVSIALNERASGQNSEEPVNFDNAILLLKEGRYLDAGNAFSELSLEWEQNDRESGRLAATTFNEGLSYYLLAENARAEAPREALNAALYAQEIFFKAARIDPGNRRSGRRLEALATMVDAIEARIEREEEQEQERDEKIEALLARIRELLERQTELKRDVESADIDRGPQNRRISLPNARSVNPPQDADANGIAFQSSQHLLSEEGSEIEAEMTRLDTEFSLATSMLSGVSDAPVDTIFKRPLELMDQAVAAQREAEELLPQWRFWPAARTRQSVAMARLQEILDLFASNSDNDGEADWEEEDWEEYMDMDPGESLSSSIPMKGDFRQDALMQPLPVPNFSADDILKEEMGNQQFRQQQRAKANAGKVEKDW